MMTTFALRPNRALERAIKRLDHLASNGSVAHLRAVEELRSLLASVVEGDMTFATIINGGTVSAQWRAGRSYISVEIYGHERSIVYADQ